MKGWIEVHGHTEGRPVLINLVNVTCITDDGWIYVVKENALVDDVKDDGNIHVRETYEEIKTLIWEAQR